MRDMNNGVRPDLTYEQMDVTQMEFSAESFGVVLDKGTLDALMPDTKETTVTTIDKYFKVGFIILYIIKVSYNIYLNIRQHLF